MSLRRSHCVTQPSIQQGIGTSRRVRLDSQFPPHLVTFCSVLPNSTSCSQLMALLPGVAMYSSAILGGSFLFYQQIAVHIEVVLMATTQEIEQVLLDSCYLAKDQKILTTHTFTDLHQLLPEQLVRMDEKQRPSRTYRAAANSCHNPVCREKS